MENIWSQTCNINQSQDQVHLTVNPHLKWDSEIHYWYPCVSQYMNRWGTPNIQIYSWDIWQSCHRFSVSQRHCHWKRKQYWRNTMISQDRNLTLQVSDPWTLGFIRIYNVQVARLCTDTSRDHLRLQSDDGGRMVPAREHCRSRTQEPYEGEGKQKDKEHIQDTRHIRRRS